MSPVTLLAATTRDLQKEKTHPRGNPERFFFSRVEGAMVSQCTKYEVSRFTHYEAVNVGAKCKKWGG